MTIDRTPLRIAITGIDGCGKTTISRLLSARLAATRPVIHMPCPDYHSLPQISSARISEALDTVSRRADTAANQSVKTSCLFLQMVLAGIVLDELQRDQEPGVVVMEHEPILDTIAFATIYATRSAGASTPFDEQCLPLFGEHRTVIESFLAAVAVRWQDPVELAELPAWISAFLHAQRHDLPSALSRCYDIALPHITILLDIPVPTAMARLADRPRQEMHESSEHLRTIQAAYESAITLCQASTSDWRLIRVDADRPCTEIVDDIALSVFPYGKEDG